MPRPCKVQVLSTCVRVPFDASKTSRKQQSLLPGRVHEPHLCLSREMMCTCPRNWGSLLSCLQDLTQPKGSRAARGPAHSRACSVCYDLLSKCRGQSDTCLALANRQHAVEATSLHCKKFRQAGRCRACEKERCIMTPELYGRPSDTQAFANWVWPQPLLGFCLSLSPRPPGHEHTKRASPLCGARPDSCPTSFFRLLGGLYSGRLRAVKVSLQ